MQFIKILVSVIVTTFIILRCNASPKHNKHKVKKHPREKDDDEPYRPRLLRRLAKIAPRKVAKYLNEAYTDDFLKRNSIPWRPSRSVFLFVGDTPEYERAAEKIVKYLESSPEANPATEGEEGVDASLEMAKHNLDELQKQMADIVHVASSQPEPGSEVRELRHEKGVKQLAAQRAEVNGLIEELQATRRAMLEAAEQLNSNRLKSEQDRNTAKLKKKQTEQLKKEEKKKGEAETDGNSDTETKAAVTSTTEKPKKEDEKQEPKEDEKQKPREDEKEKSNEDEKEKPKGDEKEKPKEDEKEKPKEDEKEKPKEDEKEKSNEDDEEKPKEDK